ncbi:uncharacterized protein [Macrobrachium rosenbergii]|uniref:uncharacterized protein n=1 Tax=Macrobrachium rosenbergii TaxID=79674 RepID=UPI0034D58EA4
MTVACTASAAPAENSHEHSQESSEERSFYMDKFCPGDIQNCGEKVTSCQMYMEPRSAEERTAEREKWRRSHDECWKKLENEGSSVDNMPGEPDQAKRREAIKCALQKMDYIIDGEINRAVIKKEMEGYLSDAPESVQKSVLTAVDTCPASLESVDTIEGYPACIMKACLSAV